MLGMLVQCTKDLYLVLTVEALCVLSCRFRKTQTRPALVVIDLEVVGFFDFAANCKLKSLLKLIYRIGHVKNERNKKKLEHRSWGL